MDQALALRLASHHLARRLPASDIAIAAEGGIRDRPPDGAGPALRARIERLSPERYARALATDDIATVYAMRSAAYVIRTADEHLFAAGCLPPDEASLQEAIRGWAPYLAAAGYRATEALQIVTDAVTQALASLELPATKGAISTALHDVLPPALEPMCPGRCGVGHAPEPLFRLAMIAAGARIVAGARPTTFVPVKREPFTEAARREASRELARRFLQLYGPSTAEHFAA